MPLHTYLFKDDLFSARDGIFDQTVVMTAANLPELCDRNVTVFVQKLRVEQHIFEGDHHTEV